MLRDAHFFVTSKITTSLKVELLVYRWRFPTMVPSGRRLANRFGENFYLSGVKKLPQTDHITENYTTNYKHTC